MLLVAPSGIWLLVGIIILVCFFHSPLSRVLLFAAVPLAGLVTLAINGQVLISLLGGFILAVVGFGSYLHLNGWR